MVKSEDEPISARYIEDAANKAFQVEGDLTSQQIEAVGNYTLTLNALVQEFVKNGQSSDMVMSSAVAFLRESASYIQRGEALKNLNSAITAEADLQPIIFKVDDTQVDIVIKDEFGHESQKKIIGPKAKLMLGYAAALTQAKMARMRMPWMNIEELGYHTNKGSGITENQVYDNLLKPFAKLGLFESSKQLGYRLRVSPNKIFELISGDTASQTLLVTDFDKWAKDEAKVMLPPYLVNDIPVLQEYLGEDPNKPLDLKSIREKLGISRETLYDHLKELKKLGFIENSQVKQYLRHHLNDVLINAFVQKNSIPIMLHSNEISMISSISALSERTGEKKKKTSLMSLAKESVVDVPDRFWDEYSLQVGEYIEGDEMKKVIDDVLTSDMNSEVINDFQKSKVFEGWIPQNGNPKALMVLDALGIGPKELEILQKYLPADNRKTLAAAIRTLEAKKEHTLPEKMLLKEIKRNLAMSIYDIEVSLEDADLLTFPSLMSDLGDIIYKPEEAINTPSTIVEELIILEAGFSSEEDETVLYPTEKAKPEIILNKKLLDEVVKSLQKEVRMVLGAGDSLPSPWMQPLHYLHFHQSLSRKSREVPFDDLANLDLAKIPKKSKTRDHHPELSPAGALIAAVYKNKTMLVKAASRKAHDAPLEFLAKHISHLLNEHIAVLKANENGQSENGDKEKQYLDQILDELKDKELSCLCSACVGGE